MSAAAHAPVPWFEQTDMAGLMRAMGSKGYDPMPPSQHAFYEDASQPLANRFVAVVCQYTIRRGKGGKRSPVARDETGEFVTVVAIAKRLGVTTSNLWVAARQAIADGRVRIDDEGHIWLSGNVREPYPLVEGEIKAKDREELNLYNSLPEPIRLFLKELPETQRAEALPRILERTKLWKLRQADAMAMLRSQERDDLEDALSPFGYQKPAPDPRGRKRVEDKRPYSVAISFVQNSIDSAVHNSDSTSVQPENHYAQIGQPYRAASSCSEPQLVSVSHKESEASLAVPDPTTAPEQARPSGAEREPESEVERATREAINRSRLKRLGGAVMLPDTIRNMAEHLKLLPTAKDVREVLEILEDRCRYLSQRPVDASEKTWGWMVGLVRSEVKQRVPDLRDEVKGLAAKKVLR